jgi:hypothetical protein
MTFSGRDINAQVCVTSSSFLISFAESSNLFRYQRKRTLFLSESKMQTEMRKRFRALSYSCLLLFSREPLLSSVIMRLSGDMRVAGCYRHRSFSIVTGALP